MVVVDERPSSVRLQSTMVVVDERPSSVRLQSTMVVVDERPSSARLLNTMVVEQIQFLPVVHHYHSPQSSGVAVPLAAGQSLAWRADWNSQ